jgi:IS30 family transposase
VQDWRGQIVDAIPIRERPAETEDRAVPGDWEGDVIGGTKNSHIATAVERHSRFTALVKVRSKDTAAVVAALSRQIRRLPTSLRRLLTWDRGLEMAEHKTFTVATNVRVYFCDPHSPWQRGTSEKRQPLAATIPAEENRPIRLHAIPTGQDRAVPESTPAKNFWL